MLAHAIEPVKRRDVFISSREKPKNLGFTLKGRTGIL